MTTNALTTPLRSLAWLALLTALFIVYGSLVPFEYRPATFDHAIHVFARIPWLDIGEEGRADWVANLVLYLPFGFLACGAWSNRSLIGAMLLTAILGSMLAVGIEFLQIWAEPRTVSLNDIVAEVAGILVGIAAWAAFGKRLVRTVQSVLLGGPEALRAAILLYLLAFCFNSLFPFDFFVSSAEVHTHLADPTVIAWLPRGLFSLRGVISLILKSILMVPLGAAIALVWRRGLLASAASAFLLSALLEIMHLFEISARADAASIVAAMLGSVVGNLLVRAPVRIGHVPLEWVRRAAFAAAPFYLLLLPILRGWKRGHVRWGFIEQTIASMHWLPFYYHYFTSEGAALASVVSISASMVPLGALAWAARLRTDEPVGRARSYIPVAILAFFLSVILEIGGLVTAGNRPDPTNVLIAVAVAAISQRVFEWLARVLGEIAMPVTT